MSDTVTENVQLPELPDVSVADWPTDVVPTPNALPLAGVDDCVLMPQFSVIPAKLNVTAAVHTPLSVVVVMGDGHASTGDCWSDTTTLNEH